MLEQVVIEDAMRRALALARRGPAEDANPQVGCVILDPDGLIVAEGWHRGAGTPHAEVDALSRLADPWRSRIAELAAVVTLEPCNHTGRTGPCAVALAESGIGAVFYGLDDPGVSSSGGAETLRRAGARVRGGVLAGEARALLAPWFDRQAGEGSAVADHAPALHAGSVLPRPHVIVKWAQTLDGRAAAADGSSRWITGPEARADVHRRRAEADAILVGTGTLLADDPALTARAGDGTLLVPAPEQPVPVVLGHRPVPAEAQVRRHPALEAHGLDAPITLAGDNLHADLAALAARGVRSVFVEGGPTVASALLAADLADEVLVYVAPALLGGPRLAVTDLGIASMRGITRLAHTSVERLGDDLLLRGTVEQCPRIPATGPESAAESAFTRTPATHEED
ncbi:MAG: bifunctional diaminohydroxyphosphoribosylaminopyrimidine deaminase/5-amino-6-(5-phosphoribosylamino)uracil reductase RibD [Leucobacter sp.]